MEPTSTEQWGYIISQETTGAFAGILTHAWQASTDYESDVLTTEWRLVAFDVVYVIIPHDSVDTQTIYNCSWRFRLNWNTCYTRGIVRFENEPL